MNLIEVDIRPSTNLTNLFKIDINNLVEKALVQASLIVQNTAKDLAPYLSWNLKSSISVDYSKIKQLYTIIWSKLDYARIRHWINRKNPQTLRYMFRGYEENATNIRRIFENVLKQSFK